METSSGRRFWLMKSEPATFSYADLEQRPDRTEPWDGVRNFKARNYLKSEMHEGDGVLFYHSSIPQPAIVGIARVVRAGYPDHTARDPHSDHFDPRSTEEHPIWYMVDVQALSPLPRALTRDDLREHPILSGMGVLRKGNRLSVQPVTGEQWRAVLEAAGMDADKW